ncbi:VaFE repeat-containing surface-anchored protein, partial [Corynebacterium sp. MSK004]|uniref:VaFE repeat-containing surface-anchored protein n=1 Tax=Corynebacterium sp. MSK004 TaxID=3050186 RepID=UPI002550FB33
PSDEPSKSDEPSDEPSKSDEPSDEPSKSDEPSDEPSKSDEPSDEPSKSGEPSDEPSKSDEPSDEPSKSDEPSDEPSKSTTPENPGKVTTPRKPGDDGSEKNAIVSTNADFEGGLREVVAGAKIVDQVSYEGLVPGKEYFLDAQLISKADGKTVLGETIGHKFVPTAPNGVEAVTITVDESVTEPVEAAVAFETLTSKEVNSKGEETPGNETPNEIGEHKDINDKDQTVTSEDGSEKNAIVSTNADFEGGLREVVAGA